MRRSLLFPSILALAAALSVAAIFAVVRLNVRQTETLYEATALVRHTLDVQRQLNDVLLEAVEADTAHSGFILTGEDAYLTPYTVARDRLNVSLQRLADLTDDSPDNRSRMTRLRHAAEAKLAELAQTVEIRRTLGLGPALTIARSDAATRAMDQIRAVAVEMADEQAQLLTRRQAVADVSFRSALNGRIGSGLLSASLVVILAFLAFAQARMRERTAQQIADEREHLAVTVASIGDAVITTDVAGRVTLMNEVATALTGWSLLEAAGCPIHQVFHIVDERTREAAESPIDRVLREGTAQSLANPTILVARDGVERPIDDSAAPIKASDGSIQGTVLVFRDGTGQRAHDEALRDSERRHREAAEREQVARAEAEEANRLKDEFLAVLSHELRTPLNAVLGWTQILQAGAAQEKTAARALASIKRNAEAQQRLVEDLLDVSRIVTGKFPLDRKPMELRVSVGAAVDAIRPDALAKAVDLRLHADGLLVINADPYRIQQVAANLLSNAVKFTPSGGRVEVVLSAEGNGAALIVSDTGHGVAKSLQPYIFDRFRQGDGSRTRTHGGLGLGLAIVKHIVEAHGGSITVQSDGEGLGATFKVFLPALVRADAAAERGPRAAFAAEPGGLTGLRVLIVDDEPDTLELLSYALARAGATVTTAPSGLEAIEVFARTSIDLILTDVQMPDMDGFDLLEEIRHRARQLPLAIAITARTKTDDVARAALAGFAAHVTKPVDLNALVSTIGAALKARARALEPPSETEKEKQVDAGALDA